MTKPEIVPTGAASIFFAASDYDLAAQNWGKAAVKLSNCSRRKLESAMARGLPRFRRTLSYVADNCSAGGTEPSVSACRSRSS
jgi:hypothetical protein